MKIIFHIEFKKLRQSEWQDAGPLKGGKGSGKAFTYESNEELSDLEHEQAAMNAAITEAGKFAVEQRDAMANKDMAIYIERTSN